MKYAIKLSFSLLGIVLLGGLLYFSLTYVPKPPPLLPLTTYSRKEIRRISVTTPESSLTFSQGETGYQMNDFPPEIPLLESEIYDVFQKIATLSYAEIMAETKETQQDFGLDSPSMEIKIDSIQGDSLFLSVGDSYFDKKGLYFTLSTSPYIYGIKDLSYFDVFKRSSHTYVNKVIYPENKGKVLSDITQFTLKNGTETKTYPSSDQAFPPSFSTLPQLHGTSVVSVLPTEEEKLNYWVSTPAYALHFTIEGQNYPLAISQLSKDSYYVLSAKQIIYKVPKTNLSFLEQT